MRILLLIFALLFVYCDGGSDKPYERKALGDRVATTAGGTAVHTKNGANATAGLLAEIDKGFALGLPVARFNGYTKRIAGVDFLVELVARSGKCANPGYTLAPYQAPVGTKYDGTKWDKDPRDGWVEICIAGQFHGAYGSVNGPMWISVVADIGVTRIATYYEWEHGAAMVNDNLLYLQTMYHQGGGHPILPQPPALIRPVSPFKPGFVEIEGKKLIILITE